MSAASLQRFARSAPLKPGVARARSVSETSGAERLVARVNTQDGEACVALGAIDDDSPIEAPRAEQRRVEDVGPVRGRDDDRVVVGRETVHLREELVECLLALVVASAEARAARTTDGVDLVDEYDGRCGGLRLVEELAHPRGADSDEELDELRTVHVEERHLGLACDRACEQRLARPRRADEENAARQLAAEPLEAFWRAQELDDLLQVALRVAEPGHVVEADSHVVLPLEPVVAALQDRLERAAHLAHRPASPAARTRPTRR